MNKIFYIIPLIFTFNISSTHALIGCSDLEGLSIYSNEEQPQFLGIFSKNKYASESISNKYGNYGSKYSSTSIFDQYGNYGSKYSNYSPWNKYASYAPFLVDDELNIKGILTNNKYTNYAVNTLNALTCIIDYSDERLDPYLEYNLDEYPLTQNTIPISPLSYLRNFEDAIKELSNTSTKLSVTWDFPNAKSYSVFIFEIEGGNSFKKLEYIDIPNNHLTLDKELLGFQGSGKIEVNAYDFDDKYIGYSNYYFLNKHSSVGVLSNDMFIDIDSSVHQDAINFVKEMGIVQGYNDGTFKPDIKINRAEFTKIIIETLDINIDGENCFKDVTDQWFSGYVCTAKEKNIISGYEDGTFKPSANINQAEAFKIIVNGLYIPKGNEGEEWFDIYVNTMKNNSLLSNISLSPSSPLLRGEMAQLIYNVKSKFY